VNIWPKKQWLRFSLRTVFIVTAMVAAYCAGWKSRDLAIEQGKNVVQGQVLWIMEDGSCQIDLGRYSGMRAGMKLQVTRAGENIAEIVVMDADVRGSACRIQPSLLGRAASLVGYKTNSIHAGDSVIGHSSDPVFDLGSFR
jgi:hypothetical protein